MIIVLKPQTTQDDLHRVENMVKARRLDTHVIEGSDMTIIGCIGDTSRIDPKLFEVDSSVTKVMHVQEPYKLASRAFHPEDSVIDVSGVKVGGDHLALIAGPCSVESTEQVLEIAKAAKASGANMLRGGAFKPRTSPYSFQGLRETGLDLLLKAKKETGLPIVTEIMSVRHIDLFRDVDLIQIGARDMQNYELLKEVGKTGKPVLLKRGFCNTIEEWLMSAEYVMSEGSKDVILCERGIRTFEPYTRNTLDLSAIPVLKELTHLPVIVDPSHASGLARLVKPLSLAAVGAGSDGLMIEVHNDPLHALCDGAQSVRPDQFEDIAQSVNSMLHLCGKNEIL